MSGYKMMAESYDKLYKQGAISETEAQAAIRIYDFLDSCSDDDINMLYDSSAFNEISKSYVRLAVRELVSEGVIDDDQAQAVRNRFSLLHDEKRAGEVA